MRMAIYVFFSAPPVKYHHVGKLLKAGEEPAVYSDDEEPKDENAQKNDWSIQWKHIYFCILQNHL